MKKFILTSLTLFCFYLAVPQVVSRKQIEIRFNKVYSAESKVCMDAFVEMKVSPGKVKYPCKITFNQGEMDGFLVKDTQEVNRSLSPNLYGFYLPKHVHPILGISFYTEDEQAKAIIFNQTYLKIFRPCFEVKGIQLALKNSDSDIY